MLRLKSLLQKAGDGSDEGQKEGQTTATSRSTGDVNNHGKEHQILTEYYERIQRWLAPFPFSSLSDDLHIAVFSRLPEILTLRLVCRRWCDILDQFPTIFPRERPIDFTLLPLDERPRAVIAEMVRRALLTKAVAVYEKKISIEHDDVGFGYDAVFGPLLNDKVTHCQVEEPDLVSIQQTLNFVQFCQLVAEVAKNVKTILLVTVHRDDHKWPTVRRQLEYRASRFAQLKKDLLERSGIRLSIIFYDSNRSREIRFDNGWTVEISDYGLDFYQDDATTDNLSLRKCEKATLSYTYRPPKKSA